MFVASFARYHSLYLLTGDGEKRCTNLRSLTFRNDDLGTGQVGIDMDM